jgi:hypothetical protein
MSKGAPYYLPQMHMPYQMVLNKLDEEGIEYNLNKIHPNDLKASQPFTYSDQVEKVNKENKSPIWIDKDNNILDGHHHFVFYSSNNKPIDVVRINLDKNSSCRILNKIQDIFEYEERLSSENSDNQTDFLTDLEQLNQSTDDEDTENNARNPQIIIAFRKEPIKDNSIVGNFFILDNNKGFDKYEIEFENLLDTDNIGVTYKKSQDPIDVLAKLWFPNINFEKISNSQNCSPIDLKAKAIAKKAQNMGCDGIKYGDKLLQGLK